MGYSIIYSLDLSIVSLLNLCIKIAEGYHLKFGEFEGDRFRAKSRGIVIYSDRDNREVYYSWHSLGLVFAKDGDLDYVEGYALSTHPSRR